jgi:hypothetical protein
MKGDEKMSKRKKPSLQPSQQEKRAFDRCMKYLFEALWVMYEEVLRLDRSVEDLIFIVPDDPPEVIYVRDKENCFSMAPTGKNEVCDMIMKHYETPLKHGHIRVLATTPMDSADRHWIIGFVPIDVLKRHSKTGYSIDRSTQTH